MAKVGDIGWFWCYPLGKAWKVLDRIQNIDPKDTHPYHTYQDSYYEHFQPATDEELAELGLCRKEKLDEVEKELGNRISDEHNRMMGKCDYASLEKKLDIAVEAFEEIELYRYDVNDIDQEDWFKIATSMAKIAKEALAKLKEIK